MFRRERIFLREATLKHPRRRLPFPAVSAGVLDADKHPFLKLQRRLFNSRRPFRVPFQLFIEPVTPDVGDDAGVFHGVAQGEGVKN